MDTEHRHELKENDLAEFLTHFGQTWRQYGNLILTVVLVLVIGFTAMRWFKANAASTQEQAWRDLTETTSPDGYRAVALTNRDPAVRALAYLRGADQLLAQSAAPFKRNDNLSSTDQTIAETSDQDRSSDLDGAASMYEQVIRDEQIHLVYKLNAQMGLAAVAECRHDWGEAREQYEKVSELASEKYATISQRAKTRATLLDRLNKPVVFAPDPVTTQPNFSDVSDPIPSEEPIGTPEVLEDTSKP